MRCWFVCSRLLCASSAEVRSAGTMNRSFPLWRSDHDYCGDTARTVRSVSATKTRPSQDQRHVAHVRSSECDELLVVCMNVYVNKETCPAVSNVSSCFRMLAVRNIGRRWPNSQIQTDRENPWTSVLLYRRLNLRSLRSEFK